MSVLEKISKLDTHLVGLAPMYGVTDLPFRLITKKYGGYDIGFTEFVHVRRLVDHFDTTHELVQFQEAERPIIAQVFGNEPDFFYKAAHILFALGFDGIDVNMGCPDKSIMKSGGGGAVIGNEKVVLQIVNAIQRAREEYRENGQVSKEMQKKILVFREKLHITEKAERPTISIKTRIGKKQNELAAWIPILNKTKVDFITMHGRTVAQMYKGTADWEAIYQTAEQVHMPVLGNGDITSYEDAYDKMHQGKGSHSQLKGVLIGRAAMGNPWIFQKAHDRQKVTKDNIQKVMLEHIRLFKKFKSKRSIFELQKHIAWYLRKIPSSKEIRTRVAKTTDFAGMEALVNEV